MPLLELMLLYPDPYRKMFNISTKHIKIIKQNFRLLIDNKYLYFIFLIWTNVLFV